jgi:hypothetical protein
MSGLKHFSMMTVTAALLLPAASCIDGDGTDGCRVELRLSSGVAVQTRADFSAADAQIPGGQRIAVYVDDAGDGSPLYGNNVLTADGHGGFSGGTPMYFPDNGHGVNIYAIRAGTMPRGAAFPADTLAHTVSSDQRTFDGYASSDLLYARATDVAGTSSAVPLTFHHLLAKLQVAIVVDDGLSPSRITGLTVGGTKIRTTFMLSRSVAPTAVTATAYGAAADIAVSADVSPDFDIPVFNDAVIVPQIVAAGTDFITVHIAGGDNLIYKFHSPVPFDGRKKYEYRITARPTGLTVTCTVSDWTPVNPAATAGYAEMEEQGGNE